MIVRQVLSDGVAIAAGSNTNDVSANDVATSRPSGSATNGTEPSPGHFEQSREFRSKAYGPYDQGAMAFHEGPVALTAGLAAVASWP